MLPRDIVRKLHRIRIRTNRLVEAGVGGEYHSVFRGRGMEFSEVREYVPGDDVRTIDWNVTARTGVPHVKKYVEERDLTVLLLLDLSASQGFGSQYLTKRELMAELALREVLRAEPLRRRKVEKQEHREVPLLGVFLHVRDARPRRHVPV